MNALTQKMTLWLLVALLAGCQPSDGDSSAPFAVGDQFVTLHKGHLLAVKTELYTPSFALQGVILPKQEHNVTAKTDGKLSALLVEQNAQVTKGQVLGYFRQKQLNTVWVAASDDDTDDTNQTQSDNKDIAKNTNQTVNETADSDEEQRLYAVTQTTYAIAEPIYAPISGTVTQLHRQENFGQDNVIMTISDQSLYHFVSVLPAAFDKYIEVGDHVNFSLTDDKQTQQFDFAGQVAKTALSDDKARLSVTVHIIPDDSTPLTKGLQASGWITYGDLSVGAVVPAAAFADGVNLHALTRPPYKPATPTPAHVWVVRQDGTLSLAPVRIVAYKPAEGRYLVTGISDDSLIVSANLPKSAQGMVVKVN